MPDGGLLLLQLVQHQPLPWLERGKVACLVSGLGVETGHDRQPRLFDGGQPRPRQIVRKSVPDAGRTDTSTSHSPAR